ncbi:helix-turn-helix transcriptional regulator [Streptomyces sp. NPDC057616]|uniref:helix-turn-helix transcriptional regulator n=1 Tax=Streptomyces sp. NPDC057616 TaxID=3346183 RepID=UPI0036B16CAD
MTHQSRRWTFLTNHARVLTKIARDPGARSHQLADTCHISERTAQRVVAELETASYLRKQRIGRRNRYVLNSEGPLRHPAKANLSVSALLEFALRRDHHPDASTAQ